MRHMTSVRTKHSFVIWSCSRIKGEVLCNYVVVCVEVLRPSQPTGVMSSAVSLPNHTFTGQA